MSGRKTEEPGTAKPKRRRTPVWLRKPGRWISQNGAFAAIVAWIAVRYLKFVFRTNSWVVEPDDILDQVEPELPVIVSVWHGQHVLLPAIPIGLSGAVMISRSLDGEITARVAEAFGASTIRASGGRNPRHTLSKGALRGFLEMLRMLKNGQNVLQTADIPKGTPRRVGQGIISLAQKSGRPIVPLAVASSRRWVLPKSWDRTTINLPFGKSAIVAGERVRVSATAGPDELEAARIRLKDEMDRITRRAYELTGVPEPEVTGMPGEGK
ncbi:lysophospholipid acyltransferase family protein [Salaquimonas pukyongi]|uniref:lysophospholipid acyltransferase family protein n=1 Tax=Salaquimonas pukyongi TaxID=2712698 RepID=UPI00096BA670|nr:lysophospholipid acyltransferase family protein [Salaquimonas pukyongi]